jgi:hypothetical protein
MAAEAHILEILQKRFGVSDDEFAVIIGTRWRNLKISVAGRLSPRYKYVCRAYQYAKQHGIPVTIEELMEEWHEI